MATENHGPQVMAVGILFIILTWFLTMLRCYVRIALTRLFRSDDWLALATLGVYTLYCSFVLAGAKHGTGRHVQDLSQDEIVMSMKWFYCGEITYVLTTCLVKVYIGIFLGQICIQRSQIIVIWSMCVAFTTFSVYFLFILMFQCRPISYFWIRFIPGSPGSCLPSKIVVDSNYAHSVLSATVDWTLGIIPIFIVWNLNLNLRSKISVAVILALGAVGSIATIVRIPYIHQLAHTSDFLFANTGVSIWSTVEPGMGIVAFSIACLRPLFRTIYQHNTHLDSFPTTNGNRTISRRQYISSKIRSQNRMDDLAVPSEFPKTIHVTTVIDTYSSRNLSGDVESGGAGPSEGESEITEEEGGERRWDKGLSGNDALEMGRVTPFKQGVSVLYQAGTV